VPGLLPGGRADGLDAIAPITRQRPKCLAAEDATSMANSITLVMDGPSLRWHLAQASQQMVLERFTLDRMVADMERWLNGAIGPSRAL